MFFYFATILFATAILVFTNGVDATKGELEEYCMIDSFHPQCPTNEVILMESATYGRMRIGKCIKAKEIEIFGDDTRYLGCSVDVLSLFDEKCSGKADCEVRVYDISDEKRQPCFSDLKMYLEASYRCIKVADERRTCNVPASNTPTHVDTSQTTCGTKSQPWIIEAPLGQKLVVSLLDLTPSESNKGTLNQCNQLGFIVDRVAKRNISICRGRLKRESQLYTSMGNSVNIFLNHQSPSSENSNKFPALLKFGTVGCTDIVPSEDTWLKRKDDTMVIGCYSSRQTWQLSCIGGKWTGVVGNCSQDIYKVESFIDSDSDNEIKLSPKAEVLAIVSICGFTLAICFIIICIGAICLRRYYIQNKGKSEYRTLNYENAPGKSREFCGQTLTPAFPIDSSGDPANGLFAHQMPTYSVYMRQDGTENTDMPSK